MRFLALPSPPKDTVMPIDWEAFTHSVHSFAEDEDRRQDRLSAIRSRMQQHFQDRMGGIENAPSTPRLEFLAHLYDQMNDFKPDEHHLFEAWVVSRFGSHTWEALSEFQQDD